MIKQLFNKIAQPEQPEQPTNPGKPRKVTNKDKEMLYHLFGSTIAARLLGCSQGLISVYASHCNLKAPDKSSINKIIDQALIEYLDNHGYDLNFMKTDCKAVQIVQDLHNLQDNHY